MKKTRDAGAKARGRPRSFDRDAALERAMYVFWRHGYEATSLNDLTAAMGINPPSLYAAFGDKERLFLTAVESYSHGPGNSAGILAEAATARLAIQRLLEEWANNFTRRRRPPGCMVTLAAINCSPASARVQAAVAGYRASSEMQIKARLDLAVKQGELPPNTDTATIAKFYYTVLEGMSIQARDGASRRKLLATAAMAMRAWPG